MASPNDNFNLKDSNSFPFKMRSKDISVNQDGTTQFVRHLSTLYPVDYGVGGCYRNTAKSNVMVAGLAASSPIYTFRNPSANLLALLFRLRIQLQTDSVGFAAGLATFDLYRVTAFTAMDTGGASVTLTGSEAKMRTAMAASSSQIQYSQTATLTAGTRTLDAAPIDTLSVAAATAASTVFQPQTKMFDTGPGDHPLLLAQNEGFVIRATVPATGTWRWAITPEWAEVPNVLY